MAAFQKLIVHESAKGKGYFLWITLCFGFVLLGSLVVWFCLGGGGAGIWGLFLLFTKLSLPQPKET